MICKICGKKIDKKDLITLDNLSSNTKEHYHKKCLFFPKKNEKTIDKAK